MTKKCPCKDSLCIAICKRKDYGQLIKCNLLMDYLYEYERRKQTYRDHHPHPKSKYQIRLEEVIKIFNLKPVYIYLDSYSKDDKQDKIISQKATFG